MKEEKILIGKCWAALRENAVVMTISMNVPSDVDFELFRERAISTLKALGTVRAGELYKEGEDTYFLARPDKHQNRSKRTRGKIEPIKLRENNK